MERTLSIPDGLASDVTRFAAANDIETDRAYELLVAVGLDVLAELDLEVEIDNGHLVLDCPACGAVFDDPGGAVSHECVTE